MFLAMCAFSCSNQDREMVKEKDSLSCLSGIPSRFSGITKTDTSFSEGLDSVKMVLIPAGEFTMGGTGRESRSDELPQHIVKVDSFFMDEHEVTNAQFKKFVDATGYMTTAEIAPDWEEMKKTTSTWYRKTSR
jgi:sulfatase modifying factor 1